MKAPGAGSILAVAAALLCCGEARAVDTTETFEPGDVDLELYLGYGGLGLAREERLAIGDLYLGYGLAERFSAFAGVLLGIDSRGAVAPDLYGGVFGTPIDGEHFDLDLLLAFDALGPRLGELLLTPGLELNLDFDSRAGPWGAWIKVSAPIGDLRGEPAMIVEIAPGLRWSPREWHELLLQLQGSAHPPGRQTAVRLLAPDALAFGYNVALTDWLELLSQVRWSMPRSGAPGSAGVLVGLISNPTALLAGR